MMNVKTIVNSKGEVEKTSIQLTIEGCGGAVGIGAVTNLTEHIKMFKDLETEGEIYMHKAFLCGYTFCCRDSGFITEKSQKELLELIGQIAKNELVRVQGDGAHAK